MGRKGKTSRLKRNPAPKFWPIHRKEDTWVVKPSSGPHNLHNCLPMSLVLRDILEVAETRKEAKKILHQGKVTVNGKVQRKDDFPVGLMDVLSMDEAKRHYRILPSHKGLFLSEISKEETGFKLSRIEDKTTIPGGVQLNLHDGSNIIIKVADAKNPVEDTYNTFDVLKISLPSKDISTCIPLKEGNYAVITGGKNIGVQGKIAEIEKAKAKKRVSSLVVIEDDKGSRYQTIFDFVFSLGDIKPQVSTMEAATVV